MSIQGDINELNSINSEIKRINSTVKSLRNQARIVESRILEYLVSRDQPGLKYKGTAIIVDNKHKRIRKNNKQIESDALQVLRARGINDGEAMTILNEIIEARKGVTVGHQKLKIQPIKQK